MFLLPNFGKKMFVDLCKRTLVRHLTSYKILDSTCSSSGSQLSSSRTSEGTAGFRGLVCGEAGMQPSVYGYPRDESGEPEYGSGCSALIDLPGTIGLVY